MYTDLQGWVDKAPQLVVALIVVLVLCGIVENTDRGRQLTDALIDRIEKSR